mgnify:CR=1 FL=1
MFAGETEIRELFLNEMDIRHCNGCWSCLKLGEPGCVIDDDMTGAYPLRFDGNGPIADILVGMQMQGLPIDYVVNRNAYIEAVTLDDVKRVAARLMQPEGLRFVVVGQPAGLVATE